MSTKVSAFVGGLGIDARNKFEVNSNATVTVGDGSSTGNLLLGGDIVLAGDLAHAGDSDTKVSFLTDQVQIQCGGVEALDATSTYIDLADRVRINVAGDLECEGDIVAFTSTSISDKNYKEEITPLVNALDTLLSINGYSFVWKDSKQKSIGVIAQEVEEILPELVSTKKVRDATGIKVVNYDGIIAILIETIKELNDKINKLESKIDGTRT